MDSIQTDVSNPALITAIRANLCAFFRHLGESHPADYFEDQKFARLHTPIPHPMFNLVLCSDLPADGDETFIQESIQYFRAKGTDIFTWWLEPPLVRSDWEPALSKYGFNFSGDTPGMAVDLQALDESVQTVEGLEVRVVADEAAFKIWAHIFTLGYGLPLDWEKFVFDVWGKLGFDSPIRNYLGYWNGQPVSTSCLFLGGGAAGIYNVATLPKARGRGIGAALTLKPLQDARAVGYRIGTLQASEMGYSVYKKLGFKHLCQMENFYLSLP